MTDFAPPEEPGPIFGNAEEAKRVIALEAPTMSLICLAYGGHVHPHPESNSASLCVRCGKHIDSPIIGLGEPQRPVEKVPAA